MYRKKQTKLKNILIFIFTVSFAVFMYFIYFHSSKTISPPVTPSTTINSTETNSSNSQPDLTPISSPQSTPDKLSIIQYEGEDSNQSTVITGSLSSLQVVQEKLILRVNIDQYFSRGTCTLNLLKDNISKYTTSVNLINSVSTSTCEGFDVPINNLPKGNYQIEVILTSDSKTGKIFGEVTL